MASLNLKIEERERLYYNKYTYKVSCNIPGAYYTNNVKTIYAFKSKMDILIDSMGRHPTYLPRLLTDKDYDNIEKLINYIVDFEKNNLGSIRREGNTISFYSNDLDHIKKAPSIEALKIYQAVLLPTGVIHFKRAVPAPYRVYLKESSIPISLKKDLLSFIEKSDGLEASSALMTWLNRNWHHRSWCSKTYYINYTDSKQLTMLHLLFPEIIGKNYKLEKK